MDGKMDWRCVHKRAWQTLEETDDSCTSPLNTFEWISHPLLSILRHNQVTSTIREQTAKEIKGNRKHQRATRKLKTGNILAEISGSRKLGAGIKLTAKGKQE